MKHGKRKRKKHLSFEQKRKIVQDVLEKGRHKKDVAAEYKVHVNSVNNWIRIYRLEGVDGLRGSSGRTVDAETQTELDRLREVEKKYNEQLEEIEILKKYQAFLKVNENKRRLKP